ncbi:McrBC 5-methylcytosine restriction system component [Lentzea sp. NBRC 105346]|uniref:McrC family protein n=1 Tax=Lentzea sp. NBRC 105346 TaxID=3032205 RepID=UPI0024A1CFAA|nr:restriction endonuclease [Lentzea sp. NBRC 105346]GLZ28630.1 McrBC 5-methylcytosine restriction system component [Lentzea sp. NBRC 105346]
MITLRENSTTGAVTELTAPQLAFLRSCPLVSVRAAGSGYRLVPRPRQVGAVHAHGLDVVVSPKVSIPRLLFMIGYANNPRFLPENVEGVSASGLWAIVAETLCRNAERALAGGVLQGYTTTSSASTVLRGRIRVGDQITRRPGRSLPVEITHDEYTVDIPENRTLRAAIRRMRTVPRLSPLLLARLRHLDNRLPDVSPVVSPWRPNRLNARYQPALRIADLVLDTMSFEVGASGLSIASFVVNMDRVFEAFVTTALREAWSSFPGRTVDQFRTSLDEDGSLAMRPDVVHLVDGRPRFVVDAKYKLESPNTDHYQVLAYCTALQVTSAWLVYASGTGSVRRRRVRNSPITITEYPLRLDVPPADLLAQISDLAHSAWAS